MWHRVGVLTPPDERVKRKAQSAEEMGEKHDPLMGPRGGDELPLIWKPVRDVVRQVSGLPQLFDLPLRDGGGHPSTSRSGHDWRKVEVGSVGLGAGARVRRDG